MNVPSAQARTTFLLRSADSDAGEPLEQLVPLLYRELKGIARRQLGREGSRSRTAWWISTQPSTSSRC
jgi:hypothetical protein